MPELFLSYRRADTAGYAGRLATVMRKQFGEDQVFQDIETIAPGSDFRATIETAIGKSQVLLVLIGNTWLTECDKQGQRRLSDPADFVRLEIAIALRRGLKVLPVLVEGARMPSEEELPADIKALARRQALELSDSRWDYDCNRLVKAVEALIRKPFLIKHWLGVLTVVLLLSGLAGGIWFTLERPADVSGHWTLPSGSTWLVTQQGTDISIDEVHYQSKQVWKRGKGRIERKHLSFNLDLVFDQHGPHYSGEADISDDGKSIKGEIVTQGSASREPLLLIR
ncbi:MAG: toll/interleukin-1 receptor domain-containing protein [Methylococcaceae bacterium]|nr:toll/interleukin-1 receptor domain-containing protein [Methylococcaceae bacterium]MDZ4158125.1 toll/interleukin-1 receptor domain-containing protein [Methylococcales bacterium]MDP2392916.1 toll/interleukin-1 receptor domain-containing protein [Methylococcaceae bacterium]MDP3020444.1 toll/interleukin-1 receptor domain-containing protein [Methylococcaceae bacterium]MDP3390929.1 toll/interleukin-1 receptor domain-containing protein [Methylococcaceae bacterium]